MSFQFRPARRTEAKPLIGLYSKSGCGKTLSGLYLARGFVGPKGRIGMIETESGRGEAYADILEGGYDVLPLRDDYSPKNYGLAIKAAEQSGLDALLVDSGSHEWFGSGGVLSMAAQNQAGGKKGVQVWQIPKIDHQREFVNKLLGTSIPLVILCMRAVYPMVQQPKQGSTEMEWVRSTTLEPIQSEDILFEMFAHGWIDQEHAFHGTKYSRSDLRPVLIDGEPITIDTGRRLAAWAKDMAIDTAVAPAGTVDYINAFDINKIKQACIQSGIIYATVIDKCTKEFGVFERTPRSKVDSIVERIRNAGKKGT